MAWGVIIVVKLVKRTRRKASFLTAYGVGWIHSMSDGKGRGMDRGTVRDGLVPHSSLHRTQRGFEEYTGVLPVALRGQEGQSAGAAPCHYCHCHCHCQHPTPTLTPLPMPMPVSLEPSLLPQAVTQTPASIHLPRPRLSGTPCSCSLFFFWPCPSLPFLPLFRPS